MIEVKREWPSGKTALLKKLPLLCVFLGLDRKCAKARL
nr:MAG TPA: hypothetical protein [Caudoviricetes sp.]